jgi:hypothetical protein
VLLFYNADCTLQVLHIDLGIAFEQGMFLSTPERVPFRLTANVVDGMGAAGLEGTFRRCCETTLQVSWHAAAWPASQDSATAKVQQLKDCGAGCCVGSICSRLLL